MTDTFRGRCPVCSGELIKNDMPVQMPTEPTSAKDGAILQCRNKPDHFQIRVGVWTAAWDKFEAGKMDGLGLMKVLLGGNLAPEKPTLKLVLDESKK